MKNEKIWCYVLDFFFYEEKESQMSNTDGNDFKTFSFPLMFTYIFMLFTVKESAIKMDRQEADSRLFKELERCL